MMSCSQLSIMKFLPSFPCRHLLFRIKPTATVIVDYSNTFFSSKINVFNTSRSLSCPLILISSDAYYLLLEFQIACSSRLALPSTSLYPSSPIRAFPIFLTSVEFLLLWEKTVSSRLLICLLVWNRVIFTFDDLFVKLNMSGADVVPPVHRLPAEVLEYIIGLVSPYGDLHSCKLVCKRWLDVVRGII